MTWDLKISSVSFWPMSYLACLALAMALVLPSSSFCWTSIFSRAMASCSLVFRRWNCCFLAYFSASAKASSALFFYLLASISFKSKVLTFLFGDCQGLHSRVPACLFILQLRMSAITHSSVIWAAWTAWANKRKWRIKLFKKKRVFWKFRGEHAVEHLP